MNHIAQSIYFDEAKLGPVVWSNVIDPKMFRGPFDPYPVHDLNDCFEQDLLLSLMMTFFVDEPAEQFMCGTLLVDSTDKLLDLVDQHLYGLETIILRQTYDRLLRIDSNEDVQMTKENYKAYAKHKQELQKFDEMTLGERLTFVLSDPAGYLLDRNVCELFLLYIDVNEEYYEKFSPLTEEETDKE